ncbi:hypothetical protein K438DRAFT_1851436, partial [Mycena galopus ATCC 62051]
MYMCIGIEGGTRVRTIHSGDDGRPSSQPEIRRNTHRALLPASETCGGGALPLLPPPRVFILLSLRQYRAHLQHGGGCGYGFGSRWRVCRRSGRSSSSRDGGAVARGRGRGPREEAAGPIPIPLASTETPCVARRHRCEVHWSREGRECLTRALPRREGSSPHVHTPSFPPLPSLHTSWLLLSPRSLRSFSFPASSSSSFSYI